ncbi:hypothetical protein [Nevskia ramosa]|uniref:hypothetical protein n=1 Tax=Nevskia ramosa TaxID=64002 RepID=UPI0003B75C1A|nr:hypothetical protein [Nevskia ramosa]
MNSITTPITTPTTAQPVSYASRRLAAREEGRGLQTTAAIMAALALHMSFAVALIRSGTDAERIYAQQSVELSGTVADLGTLPAIRVVGRRAS